MRPADMLLFLFLLSTVAEGVNVKESNFKESGEAGRRAREAPNGLTDVVNLAFCDSSLSEEEKSNIEAGKGSHLCRTQTGPSGIAS